MKKVLSLLMVLVLAFSLFPVSLAEGDGKVAADMLYTLGLFKGTGIDEGGNPVYELDRPANRTEALIMLIRLLGQEAEAKECTSEHPFVDVFSWAEPYVAYAYEKGYTKGVSENEFGSSETATSNMYITFVLRALGYKDSGDEPDFTYFTAPSFAYEKAITETDYSAGDFLRGDVAVVSLSALNANLNGTDTTLIQFLADNEAVDADAAQEAGFEIISYALQEGETHTFTLVDFPVFPNKYISRDELLKYFPDAKYTHQFRWHGEDTQFSSYKNSYLKDYGLDTFAYLFTLVRERYETSSFSYILEIVREEYYYTYDIPYYYYTKPTDGNCKPYMYLFDENMNIIGEIAEINDDVSVTYRRVNIDTSEVLEEVFARIDKSFENYDSVEVSVNLNAGESLPSIGDTDSYVSYPVYVDGRSRTNGYAYQVYYSSEEITDAKAFIGYIQGENYVGYGGNQYESLSISNRISLPKEREKWYIITVHNKDMDVLGYTILPPNVTTSD